MFENAFQRALASGHISLVLDLEAVSFIDSSGIGSVVNALRQANKAGGTVKLVNPSSFVAKTFKWSGFFRSSASIFLNRTQLMRADTLLVHRNDSFEAGVLSALPAQNLWATQSSGRR